MITNHQEGLLVKDVFETTGADQAGLQMGDIIVTMDGIELQSIPVLSKTLSDLDAGTQVNLTVLRDGETISTSAVLQDREANDAWIGKYKKYWIALEDRVEETETREKAFMGVYLQDGEESVSISGTGENSGARAAGLQSQDKILAIGGKKVASSQDVSLVLAEFDPGQKVNVKIEREGAPQTISMTLGGKAMSRIDWKGCDEEEGMIEEEIEEIERTYVLITKDINEPPVPPGPPAPPEAPEPPMPPQAEVPAEAVDVIQESQVSEETFNQLFELELQDVNIFPNPTSNYVNVSFRAENQPIQIMITDAIGREIYDRSIKRFDGYFAEQIDLTDAAPGAAIITVIQGDKKVSKQIVRTN